MKRPRLFPGLQDVVRRLIQNSAYVSVLLKKKADTAQQIQLITLAVEELNAMHKLHCKPLCKPVFESMFAEGKYILDNNACSEKEVHVLLHD